MKVNGMKLFIKLVKLFFYCPLTASAGGLETWKKQK